MTNSKEHVQSTARVTMLSLFLFCIVVFFTLIGGCQEQAATQAKLSGFTMGTTYNINIVADIPAEDQTKLTTLIDTRLEQLNQLMSTYIDYSEIGMVNKFPVAKWFEIDSELMALISTSMEISLLTNGAFDITVGELVNLWGFWSWRAFRGATC